MKAISIRQPYASAILLGWKTVEIRSWQTKYRGPLLICSTQKNFQLPQGQILPGGYALGVIELVDIHKMTEADLACAYEPSDTPFAQYANSYAWVVKHLYDIIPFRIKGKQGFYEVTEELIPLPPTYKDHCAYLAAHPEKDAP